jgi:CubicO group peptidase (beta-lactamase class C family)
VIRPVVVVLALLAAVPAHAQRLPGGEPAVEPVVGPVCGARLARVDSVLQAQVDGGRAAGIAVLVVRDGAEVKAGAYGWADRESGRALRSDVLFRIASQTKAVTSVAAMMLVEEGKLRLGDPARRWIPGLGSAGVAGDAGVDRLRRPVTIRDLLTHTAGLSYGTEPHVREAYAAAGLGPAAGAGWYFADKEEPICASMDRLAGLPLVAQPGERFVYGYATDVLGCVIERVSGQPLDEFFRSRIFMPLNMVDTHFFVPVEKLDRLATVYASGRGGLERAQAGAHGQGDYAAGPAASFSGGAGLVSTLDDYGRFLQMLANGGELDGVRLLSPHTVGLMTADHLGAVYDRPGLGFGLGFEVLTDPGLAGRFGVRGSYGWGGAYSTTYWVDPAERLVALIMTQTMPSGGLDAADRFRALVYAALTSCPGGVPADGVARPPQQFPSSQNTRTNTISVPRQPPPNR